MSLETAMNETAQKIDSLDKPEQADSTTAARLKSFIERIERLEEEKKALSEDVRDVYAELKSTGFDAPTVRRIVKLRKMDIEKRREAEQLLETYACAIGMQTSFL